MAKKRLGKEAYGIGLAGRNPRSAVELFKGNLGPLQSSFLITIAVIALALIVMGWLIYLNHVS
jgi:hypothetical protein